MYKALPVLTLFISSLGFSQTWNQVVSMPDGKHHPVTFSLDGKGYAITGTNPLDSPTDDVFQYDPATNEWAELAAFPGQDRSFAIGQAYNGKGYLGFGASNFSYFNDIWEYDPATDSWDQLTTCECSGRRHPAFIIRDDKIYVGLGDDFFGDLNDWHVYDMNTDTWTEMDDIPGDGRHHPFMFPAGDHVYAGMGHSGQTIYGDWHKFNIETDTWETMQDFPGEHRVAGTQFGHQGKGYVLSGDGSNHSFMPTGEFWEYDPSNDSWVELEPHPGISRWAPGSFVINGAVYFLGGENRQTDEILDDMWTYQLTSPSSITDAVVANDLHIYPNPTSDILNIVNPFEGNTTITVTNLSGQTVRQLDVSGKRNTIDLSDLEGGVYMLSIESNAGFLRSKVVVQ